MKKTILSDWAARKPEEPCAGGPHAGICEGGRRAASLPTLICIKMRRRISAVGLLIAFVFGCERRSSLAVERDSLNTSDEPKWKGCVVVANTTNFADEAPTLIVAFAVPSDAVKDGELVGIRLATENGRIAGDGFGIWKFLDGELEALEALQVAGYRYMNIAISIYDKTKEDVVGPEVLDNWESVPPTYDISGVGGYQLSFYRHEPDSGEYDLVKTLRFSYTGARSSEAGMFSVLYE